VLLLQQAAAESQHALAECLHHSSLLFKLTATVLSAVWLMPLRTNIMMQYFMALYLNNRPYYLQDLRNAVVPLANTMAIEVRGNINGEKLTQAPEPLFTLGVSLTLIITTLQ
jgi:hypothetical protein